MKIEEYYRYQGEAKHLTNLQEWMEHKNRLRPQYKYITSNRWFPVDRSAVIIECACGAGLVLSLLNDDGYSNIEGTDSSDSDVDLARLAGLPVKKADSIEWIKDMPMESVDVVIACNFYEHLPKEVFLDFISESFRILRPSGSLIMLGPNGDSPFVGRNLFNDVTHFWAYTSTALRAMSRMVGFKNAEFIDGALAGIIHSPSVKRPIMMIFQFVARIFIQLTSKEKISYFGSFLWTRLTK